MLEFAFVVGLDIIHIFLFAILIFIEKRYKKRMEIKLSKNNIIGYSRYEIFEECYNNTIFGRLKICECSWIDNDILYIIIVSLLIPFLNTVVYVILIVSFVICTKKINNNMIEDKYISRIKYDFSNKNGMVKVAYYKIGNYINNKEKLSELQNLMACVDSLHYEFLLENFNNIMTIVDRYDKNINSTTSNDKRIEVNNKINSIIDDFIELANELYVKNINDVDTMLANNYQLTLKSMTQDIRKYK